MQRKDELSILDGCVLWGNRVIIPMTGRESVLKLLYDCHPGITKMKQIARSLVWWPGIDSEISSTVEHCHTCQVNQRVPEKAPVHTSEWPTRPWSRIRIDHLGPFEGTTILVVVAAPSN